MRRAILGVFFLVAACGGDVRSPADAVNRARAPQSADQREARAAFLTTSAAADVIASFARSYDQDALDTCLNAWVEEGYAELLGAPVQKPSPVFLRLFLSECLTGSAPRGDRDQGLRRDQTGDVRAAGING
jgi:hypothetical protein